MKCTLHWLASLLTGIENTGMWQNSTVCICIYIYIQGGSWGFPGSQLQFNCMDMENVDFILCFTVFFAFPWKCSISESINVGADKLGVCPRRKMINLHLPWMAKNAFNIFPIGIAVSYIFQFLLISTKCHNPLENHGRNEHHIFFIFAFPNLFFGMPMENVVFTTVFYVFLWNGLINRTSIFIAEELDVCPCWNRKILHLPWMTKDVWNMLTIWSAVSFILVVRFRSRTCDNALENHGRNEERTFFIFASMKFFWWRWNMLFSHCVLQCFMFFTWRYYTPPPPHPPSVNNNETFNVTPSSNQATSSRIQHHPTHFTWRYYTPPTPPPPFCKQQRNFQRNTIFEPSNIFQDSTSSNALHMTLLHPPPPPPPPPPISIQEQPLWYSIKTEGSSKLRGTPSLEPIYT